MFFLFRTSSLNISYNVKCLNLINFAAQKTEQLKKRINYGKEGTFNDS